METETGSVINDYEVLGVGGLRRREILRAKRPLALHRNLFLVPKERREFYEAAFAETLSWLRPEAVLDQTVGDASTHSIEALLLADFKKHFPETLQHLATLGPAFAPEQILATYNKVLPWQGPLISDHFRFIPRFLQSALKSEIASLTSEREWLRAYVSFTDFGRPRREEGILILNPSLQVFSVKRDVADLSEGLFVFFADPATDVVREYKLDAMEAELLDALHEDRKFSATQLAAYVADGSPDGESAGGWTKKLSNLLQQGIILA